MDELLKQSLEIYQQAVIDYTPDAVVAAFSGGDDSRTAVEVASALGIKLDGVIFCNTRTGIQATVDHVREVAPEYGRYIEADAGQAYEDYVLRKGFFGAGDTAHRYAYHVLKAQHLRTAVSRNFRHGKRGRNILILNGVRWQESDKRNSFKHTPVRADDAAKSNLWVNIINHWSKRDCLDFLRDQGVKRNPVSTLLHKSGECWCGTMQRKDEAEMAAALYPDWGNWWRGIRQKVKDSGFAWDWGEDVPPEFKARKAREKAIKAGQLDLFDDWLPMCQSCVIGAKQPAQRPVD